MILIALLIGAILIVAAIRGTQGTLFSALAIDVPGYLVWAAAIVALGAIGFIPELKPISRGLLVLVIIVIILGNYQAMIAGFQAVLKPSSNSAASTATNQTSAAVSSPAISSPSLSVSSSPVVSSSPSNSTPSASYNLLPENATMNVAVPIFGSVSDGIYTGFTPSEVGPLN